MEFDHATIVTPDIEATRNFFESVLHLRAGPRPPFGVPGYWLYGNDRPMVHLVLSTLACSNQPHAPRIDHIAFRISAQQEWSDIVGRLNASGTDYGSSYLSQTNDVQLSIAIGRNVAIELIAQAEVAGRPSFKVALDLD